jgi:aprataxin
MTHYSLDKYPKAEHHYLILPKEDLPDLSHLRRRHVELVATMGRLAEMFAANMKIESFKIGFHSAAHMDRVKKHMQITQNFKFVVYCRQFSTPFPLRVSRIALKVY